MRKKYQILLFLIATLFLSLHVIASNENLPEEYAIEKEVNEKYIKGLKIRDFGLIREICIPEAFLMGVNTDGIMGKTSLDEWSKRFDPANPPFKKLDACISSIDVTGTAAQVKIVFVINDTRKVTDYLNMLKIENQWRIVNIIDF